MVPAVVQAGLSIGDSTVMNHNSFHESHEGVVAGQYYCSGSCYPVSCRSLALLKASKPPTIQLSTEAKSVLGSSLELVLAYATPVAFNLLPCPSTGTPKQ